MIDIRRFVCNMLQENCYVVSDETKDCVIIDCGAFYKEERKAIVGCIIDNNLNPKHLLVTHGHLDHNFGNNTILDKFGLYAEVSENDKGLMDSLEGQAERFYRMKLDYKLPKVGVLLYGGDVICFGNHKLEVIETPGHSRGSVTFYCQAENVAFTGDTLFKGSIGRTDLPSGNRMQIVQSLRTLAQLPDKTVVLPGHGDSTTIGEELQFNPFMER